MSLKQQLFDLCLNYVSQRISTARNAIESAQRSANEETKSSAGDKYETGRAMMQQEAEWGRKQLAEALKLKQDLDRIGMTKAADVIQAGSLIFTDRGTFYISISAGRLTVEGETIFAISAESPLGIKLSGQREGSRFDFNGQTYQIIKVG